MTKKESQQKMVEKINAIQTLCKQLEIKISAVQQVDKDGIIQNVLQYIDTEEYDIEEEGLLGETADEKAPLSTENGVPIPVKNKKDEK